MVISKHERLAQRVERRDCSLDLGAFMGVFGSDYIHGVSHAALAKDTYNLCSLSLCLELFNLILPDWHYTIDFGSNDRSAACLYKTGSPSYIGVAEHPAHTWLAAIIRAHEKEGAE